MSRRGRHGHYPRPHPAPRSTGPAAAPSERAPTFIPDARIVARPASNGMPPAPPVPAAEGEAAAAAGPLTGLRRVAVADEPERAHLRHGPAVAQAPGVPPAPPPVGSPSARGAEDASGRPICTTAQLRRFIKSRPWVPMHELRRRFGIVGTEDDVTPIRVADQRLYIGLPPAEGRLIADLLAGGDVGYELSMDPAVPVVVGVYPMRPVPRA